MSYSLAYWIVMFLWLIFGIWQVYPDQPGQPLNRKLIGGTLMAFVLFLLIGLNNFGKPLHP